ncbi:MAG: hypothetical protein J0J04_07560 [Microbacterium sp.]|uniref:hypothetical protein n=1 Tax=Microbacterium sp. TaxID=51671 RepID=UPI001AD1096F|nr:hypothetical protein [Microbacterium sp.]MBN9214654.1 hypothetical protein [Microbacterium sp.]
MTTFDETLHPRGQAGNAGQFATKTNDAPSGELAPTETNWERLQREAVVVDPSDPAFNSDLDMVIPATNKTYRDMIRMGIDPNDEDRRDPWIEQQQTARAAIITFDGKRIDMHERSRLALVLTLRADVPPGATIQFEETDQGGRWLNPRGVRLVDGTYLGAADAEEAGYDWENIEHAASNIRGTDHPDFVAIDPYSGYWELPPAAE